MRIIKYIKQIHWREAFRAVRWLYRYSGLEFVYRKFNPSKKTPLLPTGFLWVVGIYSAFYGIASQRYENRVNEIQTRLNTHIALLGTPARKIAIQELGYVQGMSCPTRPYFFSISQTVHSFIGKWDKNETVNREIKRVFEGLKSDLRGVRLDRVDLSGVDFRNAVLDSSLLTDVDLSNARLHQASFRNAELHFCSLVGAQLSSTDFTQSLIHRSDLSNIRFEEIWDLRETSFPNPLPDFRVLKLYRWSSLPETEDFMRCFARTVFNRSRVSLPDSALVERFPEGSFSFK